MNSKAARVTPADCAPGSAKSLDSGLAALVMVAGIHDVPASEAQLKHHFCGTRDGSGVVEILRAARELGLKAKAARLDPARLEDAPLPAIARHRSGRFFVLAKRVDDASLLIYDPAEGKPRVISVRQLTEGWSGEAVLITRRSGIAAGLRQFDFSWFVPSILKYRALLGEVLLASFFLQLFALITPLFFQVVIDKVLVHQALTTLDVLAIGLLAVSGFEVVLGGLRTYLYAHTSYRIDVSLGAELFRHLLRLPVAYFEARRVGDTVARVRELESIRNFLTGSALTVVVDSLFTVVFLAVMYLYSPLLLLVVLAAIPAYVVLSIVITPVLRRRLHEKFNRGADNQAFL
ncbi:MAG: ABC transporter transmembrane domain-containing protein, partial [Pseudomonadota bacterium]|nr:ABC transporter transmembrane domain-containing protein [Pseudomonadota bacterium]